MNISSKLTYRFEITAREFSLIRRGLEALGPAGSELVRRLIDQQKAANETILRHMQVSITLETDSNGSEK